MAHFKYLLIIICDPQSTEDKTCVQQLALKQTNTKIVEYRFKRAISVK